MRPLSASEAISPAIQQTRLVLYSPFRLGRTWKLCATAYVSRYGTLFFPFTLIYLAFVPTVQKAAGKGAAIAFVVAMLAITVLFVWIFHLCSRLQFAYFDIVVNRGEFVAPAWRKYGPQSRSWTWFKVLLGCIATSACALPLIAYIHHLLPVLRQMQANPGAEPPPQFIAAIFAGYGLFILVFGSGFLISSLLADFMLPSLALEDIGIGDAWRRMIELIRHEPGEFCLYVLLKVLLAVAGYMGIMIAWELAFILVTAILAGIAFAIGFALHLAGLPTAALMAFGIFLGVIWYLFNFFFVLVYCLGGVLTFVEAYPLYFLGGRYPLLGDLLDRSEFAPYSPAAMNVPPGPVPPPAAAPPAPSVG